ncbi:MAG: MMPL family transporter, partial [Candidatus Methanomethylophilaceae archaeon]|nr:MMPL family transporter [Candidatus Methanomethylophilaceae archaeon]
PENHNVTAVFEKTKYVVEFSSSDSALGSVSATVSGAPIVSGQSALYGNELVFTATPADGCRVDYWEIYRDGVRTIEYTHDTEIQIGCASYDYEVVAIFGTNPTARYSVSYPAATDMGSVIARADGETLDNKNGTEQPAVLERSHLMFSAIPTDGYMFKSWTIQEGTELPVVITKPTLELHMLTADTVVTVEFAERTVESHTLSFASNDESLGTVTATVDGKEVPSGTKVKDGSRVVITAHPNGDNIVHSWQYSLSGILEKIDPLSPIPLPIVEPLTYTSYTSKTEHLITGFAVNEDILITFGPQIADTVTVTTTAPSPAAADIVIMQNGVELASGASIVRGSNVYFIANIPDGYHIDHWELTPEGGTTENIKVADESLSLYNVKDNITVTYEAVENDFVVFTFGANNSEMGSVKATCNSISQQYVERPNAPVIYQKLNDFANELMNLTTDGKKNVAIAIGPLNGDMLFDGKHEWVMDTVAGVLPSEFQPYIGNGMAYDALTAIWNNYVDYEMKETANYLLAYRLGFISRPFTEIEGGQEYQYVKFMVVTKDEPMSALSVKTVQQLYDLKDAVIDENRAESGTDGFAYSGYLSGAAVSNYETSVLVNKDFRSIIIVVIILLILLLFLVMRSYLTPIRAVGTIVMSVVWTLGLTYLIFDVLL